MKTILGKKIGMTQIFSEHGAAIPVTVIEAGRNPDQDRRDRRIQRRSDRF